MFQLNIPAPAPAPAPQPPQVQPQVQPQLGSKAALLYHALQYAETGGEKDPFIRTRVAPKAGSTAYGPVQMTGSLIRDYLKRKPQIFDEAEKAYAQRLVAQADKFATFGRNPKAPGYDARFDYGGSGEAATTAQDRILYGRVAAKLIDQQLRESGGDLQKFLARWRGVPATEDPKYFRKVQARLAELSRSG